MTTDILERLRVDPGPADTLIELVRIMIVQRHEAADEIERLTGLLAEWENHAGPYKDAEIERLGALVPIVREQGIEFTDLLAEIERLSEVNRRLISLQKYPITRGPLCAKLTRWMDPQEKELSMYRTTLTAAALLACAAFTTPASEGRHSRRHRLRSQRSHHPATGSACRLVIKSTTLPASSAGPTSLTRPTSLLGLVTLTLAIPAT